MAQRVAVGESVAGPKRTSTVRVAVRLRPYMEKQDEKGEGSCVRGLDSRSLEIINWKNATEILQYEFDVFHGEETTQKEVFVQSVKPILPHVLNGQNASVFAYGPTGAGKTHTMLGSREQPGVIPRAVREVFQLVRAKEAEKDDWEYSISMSYLEIYKEKVLDLLCPSTQDLPIREDKDHNILIPGLTTMPLKSFADFDAHFIPASLNRTTAATELNQRSSRSHAILLIKVVRTRQEIRQRQQTGKLYLVDLAGSEDNRRTGNQGDRLKESGAINLSVFTLSKVVDALNRGTGGRVPYRDSKLTRLLQDSLGGSAHSVMITNVAPEYSYYFDTLRALNFATKSKQIVNRPFVRETVLQPAIVGKQSRCEEPGGSGEPQRKKPRVVKESRTQPDPTSSSSSSTSTSTRPPSSPTDGSVLERLLALEKMLMGTPQKERLILQKTLAQSRKEIQELKAKQMELEKKTSIINPSAASSSSTHKPEAEKSNTTGDQGGVGGLREAHLFKSNLPPLFRKHSCAKPKKKQAVVSPLQVSHVPVQQCAVVCKPSLALEKKTEHSDVSAPVHSLIGLPPSAERSLAPKKREKEHSEGKENKVAADVDWASYLDASMLEQARTKLLVTLNSGTLRELKSLQLIGDKKAKLILAWREFHGSFTQVEDLKQIEGIGDKRFSSFLKANIFSFVGN